ncbi:MAG: formylglycine-generating enzyme family protein, partial [Verrucomicrobiae bacterium]|nr:formylglycine-generating enzyme family protein [Verrucomicrobiae bacterium]NNJ87000.1 SUMF1/EgtB/PvdO family nonheme iron enzyme [Akkermansiaceae bacterium]
PEGVTMRMIPGGVFTMGSDSLIGSPDQQVAAPEHEVTLSPYWMSEAEITNAQYCEFLNEAYQAGLISIVTGAMGPDNGKRLIQGTASSSYEGKTLYTLDGTRVLKDHDDADGDGNAFTGDVEPENPLNISYIGFDSQQDQFYVMDPHDPEDFNWQELCNYQDYGTFQMQKSGPVLNDFDDWAGAGANLSDELQGWTEANPEGATNLPTQEEISDWPVTFIRWWGAKAFAEFYGARLPTEAQWEFAARGGADFVWAVHDGQDTSDANWNSLEETVPTGHVRNAISGSPNPYGLYNLAGNCWEWIADNYVAPYDTNPAENPLVEEEGSILRCWRGGSWNYHEATLQSSIRFFDQEDRGNDHFGFRIVAPYLAIQSFDLGSTGPILTWYSMSGEKYAVETSTNLVNWDHIDYVVAAGLTATYTDTDPARTSSLTRFYRIRLD